MKWDGKGLRLPRAPHAPMETQPSSAPGRHSTLEKMLENIKQANSQLSWVARGSRGGCGPITPPAIGTPSTLCPQAAPQGEVSPGAGWVWGCPDLAKPRVGVIKELMRSRRDALPSRAGFRQQPRPNNASVAPSEAGAVPMRAAVMESSPARHPWHNDSGAARMDGQQSPA